MLSRHALLNTLTFASLIPNGARFTTDAGPLEVSFYAPGIIRLKLGVDDRRDYGLLVAQPEPMAVTVSPLQETSSQQAADTFPEAAPGVPPPSGQPSGYRIASGNLALELEPGPLRMRLIRSQGAAGPLAARHWSVLLASTTDGHISGGWRVAPFARDAGTWQIALGLRSGEPVYGLGEKFGPLNRRGQLIESLAVDSLGVNAEASYKNCPFAWSPAGWGVFVHTTAPVKTGVGYGQWSWRSYIVTVPDSVMDLFFIAGDTPAAILERYTHLTGRSPALPRWSFGMWMSRCYYRTADELLAAARGLRARGIPCDVITLDGRAWLKVETRFAFEWDADRYPDPAAFCKQLKEMGFRLCVWEYPYVSARAPLFPWLSEKGYLLRNPKGETYVVGWEGDVWGKILTPLPPSAGLDFTNPDAYAWWAEKHRELFAVGVDVIKTDFGEHIPPDAVAFNGDTGVRLHNVYPLLYNRCVYEATAKWGPSGPLVWGRSGWIGSQRYPVQWGGDSQGDWEGLAASIRGGLSWGMSGVPFYTHDIGGFYDHLQQKPSPEHYVRSTQVGVLTSHTRFHGQTVREPWEYGEEAERIVKEWLDLRYRLIPYLESCAAEASATGLPVMRAMPLAFPNDPVAWSFEEQYMFGPALLVAPVLQPGGHVRFYLPAGVWTDFWTGERLQGPQIVERVMPLDRIPVYGRAGSEVPLGPTVRVNTDELSVPTPVVAVKRFEA
ncbi:MAG: glycoside hydrolase family 31 protein [Anaerolineae bacterium]